MEVWIPLLWFRGFQAAIGVLDRVIVAEMQGGGSDTSAISTAADNAFDAGAVVIAANGNNGPNSSTVNTPANAHKVIGVGNFDVQTLSQIKAKVEGLLLTIALNRTYKHPLIQRQRAIPPIVPCEYSAVPVGQHLTPRCGNFA